MENVSFHYLLMANQAVFQREVFKKLKGSGLTLGQPKVLDYLKEQEGVSQKELAGGCYVEPASLTVILNGMEDKELVERRYINGNRRTSHIFVTEKGREKMQKVESVFRETEILAFKDISEDERQDFMRIFNKIYRNLEEERGKLLHE